jgi:hypothetical protein
VTRHRRRAADVVDLDRVEPRRPRRAVEQHDRRTRRETRPQRALIEIGRHHDQSVDASAHRAERRLERLLLGV